MLAIMIARAKEDGQVDGLIPHLVEGGVSILQYADDTILFMSHDFDKALNMKLILCIFEQLSGLKINFHKSDFCFVLEQPKRWKTNIGLYSDVKLGNFHLSIWGFQFTSVSYVMGNGNQLRIVLRGN